MLVLYILSVVSISYSRAADVDSLPPNIGMANQSDNDIRNISGEVSVMIPRFAGNPLKVNMPKDVVEILSDPDVLAGVHVKIPKGSMIDSVYQLFNYIALLCVKRASIVSLSRLQFFNLHKIETSNIGIVAFSDFVGSEDRLQKALALLKQCKIVFWVCENEPSETLRQQVTHSMSLDGDYGNPRWIVDVPECAFKVVDKWKDSMIDTRDADDKPDWKSANTVITMQIPVYREFSTRRISDALGNIYVVGAGTRCVLFCTKDLYVRLLPYRQVKRYKIKHE